MSALASLNASSFSVALVVEVLKSFRSCLTSASSSAITTREDLFATAWVRIFLAVLAKERAESDSEKHDRHGGMVTISAVRELPASACESNSVSFELRKSMRVSLLTCRRSDSLVIKCERWKREVLMKHLSLQMSLSPPLPWFSRPARSTNVTVLWKGEPPLSFLHSWVCSCLGSWPALCSNLNVKIAWLRLDRSFIVVAETARIWFPKCTSLNTSSSESTTDLDSPSIETPC
mmetsp:Transcript_218/g.730  ORF Transcript_218/g.730 Transcript_218/m.730 type:complete len:233 (-) Transcript_218:624-1322(-)